MQLFSENDLAQPCRLAGNNAAMLAALADFGCDKHTLAALLAMMDDIHPDHMRFLTGPVIQHRSQWAETTPAWLIEAVTGDRLRIILEEHARRATGWQIGPAELTALIYPASMDAPLQYEYAQIYLWAAAQANARHWRKSVADIWSGIGPPVEDRDIIASGGRYHHLYRQLCSEIRSRVVAKSPYHTTHPHRSCRQQPAEGVEQIELF